MLQCIVTLTYFVAVYALLQLSQLFPLVIIYLSLCSQTLEF